MRNLPPLGRLRAFEAAARRRSFAVAAEELHLTPSAVSHQIRALEAHLGRALFERRHRGVTLTPEGARLQDGLVRAFDALEAACAEVSLPAREQVIAVHCAPSLAIKWLGPRLRGFVAAHPGLHVRLSTGAEVPDLAAVREVDVALAYADDRPRAGVEVLALGTETIAPLVSPALLRDLPGAAGDAAPAGVARPSGQDRTGPGRAAREADRARQQVQQLPLIDATLSPLPWSRWFELQGMPAPQGPRTAFDRAAMAIAAAADGLGVALESTRLAARELERGELVVLGTHVFRPVHQPVHFLHRRTGGSKPAVQAFVTWVLEQARGLAPA
jgi:LysR family glycine cleavage system transcriptional activator